MARVKGGVVSRKRRKRVLKLAKGYYGAKHILFRTAKEQKFSSILLMSYSVMELVVFFTGVSEPA